MSLVQILINKNLNEILKKKDINTPKYNINGNNFYTYIEPNNGKYHFMSYDFDLTFGKWCKKKTVNIKKKFMNCS